MAITSLQQLFPRRSLLKLVSQSAMLHGIGDQVTAQLSQTVLGQQKSHTIMLSYYYLCDFKIFKIEVKYSEHGYHISKPVQFSHEDIAKEVLQKLHCMQDASPHCNLFI